MTLEAKLNLPLLLLFFFSLLPGCSTVPGSSLLVSQLDSTGDEDPAFNAGLPLVLDVDSGITATVAVDARAQIIVGRDFTPPFITLDQTGVEDLAFDGLTPDRTPLSSFSSMATTKESGVLGSGFVATNQSKVYRYDASGPDTSFGVGGFVELVYTDDRVEDRPVQSFVVETDADNRVLIGGDVGFPPAIGVIARLTSEGNIDLAFGRNGYVSILPADLPAAGAFDDHVPFVTDIEIDNLNRIYAIIQDSDDSSDFYVARFLSNGTLDSSFGVDGFVAFLDGDSGGSRKIVQNSRGQIVVGHPLLEGSDLKVELFRLLESGELDMTFGTDGKTRIRSVANFTIGNSANSQLFLNDMAIGDNDQIVVCATTQIRIDSRTFNYSYLTRVLAEGTQDTSFNTVGYRIGNPGTSCQAITISGEKTTTTSWRRR